MADPQDILVNINQQELDKFNNTYMPLLLQMQDSMSTRSADYVNASDESVKDTQDLYYNQMQLNNEITGQQATTQQTGAAGRAASLGSTSAYNAGANDAVDTAEDVNKNVALGVLNTQTNLTNQALSDASSASGLASSRAVQNANAKQAQAAQNQQAIGMAAMTAMMMM